MTFLEHLRALVEQYEARQKENKILKKAVAEALLEAKVYDGTPEMDKIAAILEAAVREVG